MNSVKPDTVICSGAERARHTATLICESAGIRNAVVRLYDELYEADREAWINHIRSLKAETRNALCVGHNPVLSWLVSHLSRKEIDLSPAGFVIYELQGSWKEFESNVQEVFIANHPV
jgi:phosphohistidine phosphatase